MTRLTTAKLSSCERRRRTNENNNSHVRRYCFTLKTAPLFAPSARSLLFLFFSGGERVVVSWFVFYAVWKKQKNRKKTPHKIKRYRSENQKVSRGAVRLDASKLSNSACIRYSSLFRSYFQPSHSRCGFLLRYDVAHTRERWLG